MHISPDTGHRALLYEDDDGFLAHAVAFLGDARTDGRPVLVVLPAARIELIERVFRLDGHNVAVVDFEEVGRNPGRLIPAILEFANDRPGRPLRYLCEPLWPGRTPAEIDEIIRYEALLNTALAAVPVRSLCAHRSPDLSDRVRCDLTRTHPEVVSATAVREQCAYSDPMAVASDAHWPLEELPAGSTLELAFEDPAAVRSMVRQQAASAGVGAERVDDLVLAANELAANTVVHGGGRGLLRICCNEEPAIVCEVCDSGRIDDPLAGLRPPGPNLEARGLWLVNQVCDLVQVRSGAEGTCVRITLRL